MFEGLIVLNGFKFKQYLNINNIFVFTRIFNLAFFFQTDTTNSNIQVYTGTDHIQLLYAYVEEMKLGEIEFNVFRCQSKSKIPAFYANITVI